MHIKSCIIKNFGPLEEYKIEFNKLGMNIICGNNDTGKSQIFGALLYVLYGKSVIKKVNLKENKESKVTIVTEHDTSIQTLENIYHNGKFYSYFQNNSTGLLSPESTFISHYHKYKPIFFNYSSEYGIKLEENDIKFISELLTFSLLNLILG
jgi:predicted ATP-dependent endonuclease of OLD family